MDRPSSLALLAGGFARGPRGTKVNRVACAVVDASPYEGRGFHVVPAFFDLKAVCATFGTPELLLVSFASHQSQGCCSDRLLHEPNTCTGTFGSG